MMGWLHNLEEQWFWCNPVRVDWPIEYHAKYFLCSAMILRVSPLEMYDKRPSLPDSMLT